MATKKKEEAVEEEKAETKPKKTSKTEAKAKEDKTAKTASEKPKEEKAKEAKSKPKKAKVADSKSGKEESESTRGKRSEKVGVVWSDKMQKTVVVRVESLVKHKMYHKYMKKRKKFMAHDEMGSGVGDRVRIIETRPMSARKRWRVVEIIQKAQK